MRVLAFLLALFPAAALGQVYSGVGPQSTTLTDTNTFAEYQSVETVRYCSISVVPAAVFGGGLITAYVSSEPTGITWWPLSGLPDMGVPTGATQTLSASGSLTFHIEGRAAFEVVLSGSSGANVPITLDCTY